MAFVGFWWLLVASGSCCSLLLVFAGFCWLLVTCVDFRRLLLAFVAFCFCGCSLSLLCLCDAGRKKGRREGRKEGRKGREGKKAARKEGRKEGEHLQVASLQSCAACSGQCREHETLVLEESYVTSGVSHGETTIILETRA